MAVDLSKGYLDNAVGIRYDQASQGLTAVISANKSDTAFSFGSRAKTVNRHYGDEHLKKRNQQRELAVL